MSAMSDKHREAPSQAHRKAHAGYCNHRLIQLIMLFGMAKALTVGWVTIPTPLVSRSPNHVSMHASTIPSVHNAKGRSFHRRCIRPLHAELSSVRSIPYTEDVARERQVLRTDTGSRPEFLGTLQNIASLVTFVVGVGIGLSIVAIIVALKWAIPFIISVTTDKSTSTESSSTTSPSKTDEISNGQSRNVSTKDGSRTAILALYSRMQLYYMFDGPDNIAPRLLKSIGETTNDDNSKRTIKLLNLCGWLSRFNFILTRAVFEDQIAYLATLGHTGLVTPLHCRTCWFDDCLESFVRSQIRSSTATSNNTPSEEEVGKGATANLVILGAGFDTRCYRFRQRLVESKISCYEVDAGGTQKVKQRVLQKADVDPSGTVFCACDFESEDWLDMLLQNGLDPTLPTLILWEGVTMYLPKITIVQTMKSISSTAKKHNTNWYVGFDYINASWAMSRPWKWAMTRAQEPFQFAANMPQEVNDLVESCGLSVLEHLSDGNELEHRYVPQASRGIVGDYGGFVVAGVA